MLRNSASLCRSLEVVSQAARCASAAAVAPAGKRIKSFEIYRFNPEKPGLKQFLQKLDADLDQCGATTLDPLIKIKNEVAPALTSRDSYCKDICGSRAMKINGQNTFVYISNTEAGTSESAKVYKLPSVMVEKVYTFPTANKEPIRAPSTFIKELLEMFDPVLNKASVEDPAPAGRVVTPMYAAPRLLEIRRHKMRKHKRLKRYKRDRFQYLKRHREEKARSERAFRKRMSEKLAELNTFEPEAYIKDVIMRAKRDWKTEMAPTGRKLYPHWSTLMTVEELYNLPESDYIDKKAGFPEEEDRERIRQMKIKYRKEFKGEIVDSCEGDVANKTKS